jgi:hypothetical protein
MRKVYVVNKSGHDFTPAIEYGELVYLSEGSMNRYKVASMYRTFVDVMQDSHPDDYILLTGLSSMSAIACSIFAYKHGKLNLLLFKDGRYIERRLSLGELIEAESL